MNLERFMSRVEMVTESGCWIWLGSHDKRGYGILHFRGRSRGAHVACYELHGRTVPVGLELDHKCRVPACVNPDHLEPVTHAENMARGWHAIKPSCKQGHPFSGENLAHRPGRGRRCRQCSADANERRHSDPVKRAAILAYWRDRAKRRTDAAGRKGRLKGEQNNRAKLTAAKVSEIRRLHASGMTAEGIATEFGITGANVLYIVKRVTWKHVP